MARWAPSSFEEEGLKKGYDPTYLSLLVNDGRVMLSAGVPVLFTLGHLAAITDTPYEFLYDIVERRSDPYRCFRISKRTGGKRLIAVPHPLLLNVQRWIDQRLLALLPVHQASTAYSARCNPFRNAEPHCGARWLLKTDIQSFFESISERQVYYAFCSFGYPPEMSFFLTRICTRLDSSIRRHDSWRWTRRYKGFGTKPIGHLPQGAPTSPRLANLVCRGLDSELTQMAIKHGCVYTRYADDIIFSARNLTRGNAELLLKECGSRISKHGFQRHQRKTIIVPPGARKIATGLVLAADRPRIPRKTRDSIRAHLYYAKRFGVSAHCVTRKFSSVLGFKCYLRGLIEYVRSVDSQLGEEFYKSWRALDWPI